MSASARKRANLQRAAYPAAVIGFLTDERAPVHVDATTFRVVPCPDCGWVLLGCEHDIARWRRGERRSKSGRT